MCIRDRTYPVSSSVPASTLSVPTSRFVVPTLVPPSTISVPTSTFASTLSVSTSVPASTFPALTSVPASTFSVSTSVPASTFPALTSVPGSAFSVSTSSLLDHSLPFPFRIDEYRPMSPILILPDLSPVSPPSESDDLDFFSIESELLEQRLKASNYSEIIIQRDCLFDDALNQFNSLGLTRIYVKFDGEPGDDFEGLTRELISEFWKEFSQRFSDGQKFQYLNPSPISYLKEKDLIAVGKILMIGFILTGFLPTQFNNSFLFLF